MTLRYNLGEFGNDSDPASRPAPGHRSPSLRAHAAGIDEYRSVTFNLRERRRRPNRPSDPKIPNNP
jgi:hypothetical protein